MNQIFRLCIALFILIQSNTYTSQKANNYDVVGLGTAFIDYIIEVNDKELSDLKYKKGSWGAIDLNSFQTVLDSKAKTVTTSPGGSGGNVIRGLANLGQKCAVLGQVGNDKQGLFYLKSMENLAVKPLMTKTSQPTAQAICFITPDGQRTMRSLGAENEQQSQTNIDKHIFSNVKVFHAEGYQLYNLDFFERSLKYAKESGAKISIDLSSVEIVKRFKDELLNIIPKYVDIVFANEGEAFELTHLNPQESCDFIATLCDVAVVTMGDKGSWAKSGKIKFYTPAFPADTLDTTGAGDLFTSGFLYGYLENEPLQRCAIIGSLVASKVVETLGAEMSKETWEEIVKATKDIKF